MRLTKISLLILLMVCFFGSCVKQPEYSSVPHIDLLDITFRRGDLTRNIQDTLIFRLKFTDGDGDLGATSADSNYFDSYNPWYYAYNPTNLSAILRGVDPTGQLPQGYKLINYSAKRMIPQFDTLPPLVCGSWEPLRKNGQTIDTVYIRQNLKAYNVNVDVYAKNNAGAYDLYNYANYDWDKCSYNLFRATFPDLSNSRQTALDGTITFRITSFDLVDFFNTKILKMDISIYDRLYHMSNVVEKKDFTISQITR